MDVAFTPVTGQAWRVVFLVTVVPFDVDGEREALVVRQQSIRWTWRQLAERVDAILAQVQRQGDATCVSAHRSQLISAIYAGWYRGMARPVRWFRAKFRPSKCPNTR